MKSYSSQRFELCTVVVAVTCLVACAGCSWGGGSKWKFASLHPKRLIGKETEKPEPETPTRLVATWTETVLHKTGQPSQRGFGGRLMFFKNDSKDAIRVDGQLVVYAFDETDRELHDTRPTRRYIFPQDQFGRHESDSKLGATYSVWLPWDEVGGPQKKVSLIARFEPADGAIVLGEQTRHLLPGLPAEGQRRYASTAGTPNQKTVGMHQAPTPAPASGGVQLASHTAPVAAASEPSEPAATGSTMTESIGPATVSTMTLNLPRALSAAPGQPLRRAATPPADPKLRAGAGSVTPQGAGTSTEPSLPAHAPGHAATNEMPSQPLQRAQALRDFVRQTHPARVSQAAPQGLDRAR